MRRRRGDVEPRAAGSDNGLPDADEAELIASAKRWDEVRRDEALKEGLPGRNTMIIGGGETSLEDEIALLRNSIEARLKILETSRAKLKDPAKLLAEVDELRGKLQELERRAARLKK